MEKHERDVLRSNASGRQVMVVAAAASILFHAVFIAATLALIRPTRRDPTPYNRNIYVTLTSAAPGVNASHKKDSTTSGHARRMHLPEISRDVARLHRGVRRITKRVTSASGLTSPVAKSATAGKLSAAPSLVAKAEIPDRPRIGNASGSQAGEHRGVGSAGSVSGAVVSQAPVLLSKVIPGYPESARRRGIQGQVVLQFVVDQSGRVERNIEVIASLPMLDEVAIDAVRQWRFSPGRDRDGNPVRVLVRAPLQFILR